MTTIDEERLVAFADGELDEVQAAEIERALAADPDLRARLERQLRLRARIAAHYAPVAEEAVPGRLTALVGAAASGAIDLAAARQRRTLPSWGQVAALAATLLIGLVAGQLLPRAGGGSVAVRDGAMLARGELAETLETQLASAPPADARVRIGVSFAAAGGRLCRTFDAPALSGLACRGEQGWQLVAAAAAADRRHQFRQAGSGSAFVLQAAQDMMIGEPFDADAERRARDRGWRD